MLRRSFGRLLLIMFIMIGMLMSVLPVRVSAEGESSDWSAVSFSEIADGDTIAVTMSKEGTVYILPMAATGKTPAADTASVTEGVLSASAAAYGWTFKTAEDGFTIGNANGYLNSGGSNNGLRANSSEAAVWTLDEEKGYLKEISTGRYMGVYNSQDWRTYATDPTTNNIKDQTLALWKYTGEPVPEPSEEPEVELSTIAEALAGENGAKFKVKGVVTLVDSKNIYVQDETGGICLFLPAADSTVNLGDTLIGEGSRAVYRGLPELADAVIEKSEGLTLSAKETTIGSLSTADICTYVKLNNLEVTNVNDNGGQYAQPNITLKDENDASIQIYKAVINKTDGTWDLAAGDKVNVTAAVGVNNTTLQLRNTIASEIEKITEPGPEPEDPYADIDPTLNVYELQAAPADGDKVVIFNAANGRGVKGALKGNYYLDSEELTAENGLIASDAELIEWTVTANEDGTFTFTQNESTLAGKQTENNGKIYNNLTLSAEDFIKWELSECIADNHSWYISNPDMTSSHAEEGGKIYLEWYARYTEFSLYDTSGISEDNFGFTFYKLVREKKDGVKAPEADIASGEVEKGTVVTFTSATEGAVIYYSIDDGVTWTEGSTYTVNEDVTIKVKAVLGETESKIAEFSYTVKAEVIETTLLNRLAEAPADGAKIAIYHPASKMAMTATASGTRLAGEAVTLNAAEQLPLTDTIAYMNVSVTDGVYVFEQNGKYLTSGETGNSLSFADELSDLAKWTLEQQTDGTWYVINTTAVFNGNKQALEYYNNFTTYGVRADNDAYKFEFYSEDAPATVATPAADIASGEVEKGTVVTFTSATEGAVIYYSIDDGVTWTEGNTYTVNEDVTIKVKAVLGETESRIAEFSYKVKEVIIEKTLLSRLSEAPADGAKVVIYHPASGNAMTGTASGNKLAPEAVTLEDGKLPLTDTIAYMNVSVSDGQYVFELDGKYLSTGATGNNLSFADEISDLAKWTLEQQADGTWYVINAAAEYNGTKQALEYYNNFTTYGVKADNAAYKMEFYGETESETGLVKDPSQLKDGSYVVIYNPSNAVAMSSETYQDWYLLAKEAVIEDNKAVDPAAEVIWKVSVSEDGNYTFTQASKAVAAYLSGTYVELTNNPNYEGASVSWKLKECNAETSTYYIFSSDLTTTYGNAYIEAYYKKQVDGVTFCGYSASEDKLTEKDYGMQFYLVDYKEPEPSEKGDLVTDLSQLTDGTTVTIYSPSHKTMVSSKPNGDWYLKADSAVIEDNKVSVFTENDVWTVRVNENGTYSFYGYNNEERSITVWPSGNYAELSVDVGQYPDNTWTLTPAKTEDCFYISSPTVSGANGPAYIEAYVRNDTEVFSGYFTSTSSNRFTESEFALQFYLVNGEDAVAGYDDGEWDGVLNKGEQYVIHNVAANSVIGLQDPANYSMKAIPAYNDDGMTKGGNGAYVFTVDSMGRYYTFMTGGKYLATNDAEELLLLDPNEDGTAPETAKWFLKRKEGTVNGEAVSGYVIYNKDAQYGGTPVCIEYFSSVFSGWTFNTKNDLDIYLFNFCKLKEEAIVHGDIVQDPVVLIDCAYYRYVTQDFHADLSLDDLAETIEEITVTYVSGNKSGTVENITKNNEKSYSIDIPASAIDNDEPVSFFTFYVTVTNSYGITYTEEREILVYDEPFVDEKTPAPNSQTGEDKRPVVSAKICNAGENPDLVMKVGGVIVEAVFENGYLTWTPEEDLENGRTEVEIIVMREDGKSCDEIWAFTVGNTSWQLYFGQLHSHTTYSDGSGSLDTALDYIASLPESANIDFVAFTDHSNYFDTTSAANPADAMNDASLMTDASRELWTEYKDKVAKFNEKQSDVVAIAGYEMTWSGGPGHINSFNTQGLVSRNNAELNVKDGDAGMKLYYETMKKDSGLTMHQFNHPGATFGNFTNFGYWDEETDERMFLVEVGNGEGQIGAGGYYPSYEQYTLALDQGWHVAPTNNQDNHKGRWGNANDARDVVLTNDFSEAGIYDAIRARRIYATEDKNLELYYTLNGFDMGSILEDLDPREKITIEINLYDPDNDDSVASVEIISNSGAVAYAWNDPEDLETGSFSIELDPKYTYYYVRVTQKDGDLAVTAPVWTGKAAQVGIEEVTYTPEPAIVNQPVTINTKFYNNEFPDAILQSVTYTVDGSKVIGTDTESRHIEGESTLEVPFTFTPDTAKRWIVSVNAVVNYEGTELNLVKDIEISVRENDGPLPVTAIKDVNAITEKGYEFAIEGIVTSNASGYDKDTAFFDCIYVQDETGGICCFPVSGEFKIGDKVHIEGYTDFYQGEAELQVDTIEVIGEGSVEPEEVTAEQINDQSVRGKLVTLKGTVESYEKANDLIQTIMVKDEAGNLARVFIDGYITTAYEVENCEAGAKISATGLASYDDTWPDTDYFARIRIRDRKDIVCEKAGTIRIEPEEANVVYGETISLKVLDEDGHSPDVTWSSDNEEIAAVSERGAVTGVSVGKAVITAETEAGAKAESRIRVLFKDVADDSRYFFDPVYWAADNGITVGAGGPGKFSPDANCTREQFVTFLWRFMGEPEPETDSNFTDVEKSAWYYKPISWAAENGITVGLNDGTGRFGVGQPCTREQCVTFLYRAAGEPEVTEHTDFADVAEGRYFYDSISWAASRKITVGLNDGTNRFGVGQSCTRAMLVTFLYRYAESE